MNPWDRALPLLAEAHQLMWEVREVCGDAYMRECLGDAMEANRDAQNRLGGIEREAREVRAHG